MPLRNCCCCDGFVVEERIATYVLKMIVDDRDRKAAAGFLYMLSQSNQTNATLLIRVQSVTNLYRTIGSYRVIAIKQNGQQARGGGFWHLGRSAERAP